MVPAPRDRGAAFAVFYNRELAGQVRRAALLIGDRHDARDLVHDAFIEVYRRWDVLDEPGPYLNRVVLNRCRDRARTAARERRIRAVEPVAAPVANRDTVEDKALWDALQQLPFNHRAVLVLRFHHQLTTDESRRRSGADRVRSARGSSAACASFGRTCSERSRAATRRSARTQG